LFFVLFGKKVLKTGYNRMQSSLRQLSFKNNF
jgi:hypothetical protein